MQDQCAKAAELLGLHKKAKDVQTREYITGNKRVMSDDLAAQKRARLTAVVPVGLITARFGRRCCQKTTLASLAA